MTHQQDSQEEGYDLLEFDDDNNSNIQRSLAPLDGMGCFHLLLHSIMVCVKELKTVCRNTIERRRHSAYNGNNNNNNEENVSLLTESMEEDVDYYYNTNNTTTTTTTTTVPTKKEMDSTIKITALDQAMKNFVDTNDPQALLHVFDVALKDDKQD